MRSFPSPFSTSRAAKTGVERDTYPTATNSRGEITGIYADANSNPHGFVRTADGTITKFDVGTDVGTIPYSINESGTITGAYFGSNSGPNSLFHGFVRSAHGIITTFDVPGSAEYVFGDGTIPLSINSIREVTGWYSDGNGAYHGFLRIPRTESLPAKTRIH